MSVPIRADPTASVIPFAAILAVVLVASPLLGSMEVVETTIAGEQFEVRCIATFSYDNLVLGERDGYRTISLLDCRSLADAGLPSLPVRTLRIALPEEMKVTGIRIKSPEAVELPGEHRVYPAQPATPGRYRRTPLPFVGPDPSIYGSSALYPSAAARFAGQADLAGQSVAVVQVQPVRYAAAEGRLFFTEEIEFTLEGVRGYRCGDILSPGLSERTRAVYERMLERTVVNPGDVRLSTSGGGPPRKRCVDPGQYEYVIVTSEEWSDDFEPLARWRTRTGSPATVVTTEWIENEGGYTGGTVEKIRAFTEDAHVNWGAAYFLLGGDTNVIPVHRRILTGPAWGTDTIPNDTYYADFDEDWICEVFVGRAPVRNEGQIATFLNKTLAYEKNPPQSGFATTAALLGFDNVVCGDGYGEYYLENYIRPRYPLPWTIETEYDSESGLHRDDVLAYLNQGPHLVTYDDHGDTDLIGAGYVCHARTLGTADMSSLVNGNKTGIYLVAGCYTCNYPNWTCLGEACVRNPGGGAVCYVGNSRFGWTASINDPDWYTPQQMHYIHRSIFDYGLEKFGECFTVAKNEAMASWEWDVVLAYCYTELTLLGDPALDVWTADPESVVVAHETAVDAGAPASVTVTVTCGGVPEEGATVCLCKEGDIYLIEETVSGDAFFSFTPATAGTLWVTVIGENRIPYEGVILVQDAAVSVADLDEVPPLRTEIESVVPNPFNPTATVRFTLAEPGDVLLAVHDAAGRRVAVLVDGPLPAGEHERQWSGRDNRGREASSGVYFLRLEAGGERRSEKAVLLR